MNEFSSTVTRITPPEILAPTLPRRPLPDKLDGYLDALLAQSVKPHRERLVDILRIIDTTPTGRALLQQLHERAGQNEVFVVNVLKAGANPPDGVLAQDLWLHENLLTANALEIGVPVEVQHAPAVFEALAQALNASRRLQAIEHDKLNLADMQERFRNELSTGGKNASAVGNRAGGAQPMQYENARISAQALNKLSGGDPQGVPLDPKPEGKAPASHPHARRVTVAVDAPVSPGSIATAPAENKGDARAISAPTSLTELNKAAEKIGADTQQARSSGQGSVQSQGGPIAPGTAAAGLGAQATTVQDAMDDDAAADEALAEQRNKERNKESTTARRLKTTRRRLVQYVSRPFVALNGLLARRRATWARTGKPTTVPEATFYDPDASRYAGRRPSITNSGSSATGRTSPSMPPTPPAVAPTSSMPDAGNPAHVTQADA